MAEKKQEVTATLRDWWFLQCGNTTAIQGKIYHDRKKRWKNGTKFTTSKILRLDFENKTVSTLNSVYVLGQKRTPDSFVDSELNII
jgi:hypothetical protein